MCGIAGIAVAPGARVDLTVLKQMTRTLRLRGPDDEGYFVDEAGGAGLGHRRLSIIDLEGGHQPLGTADGQIQVVVNGEIYNFVALREELQGRGHRFQTRSDSEVVVHGYAEWGEAVIERLDGMFALAIWDARARRLVLARDRMGKKPMYYALVGPDRRTLIFGSELKALAAHPEMEHRVSPSALASYLAYECLPEDQCIYELGKKLPAASYLVFDRERGAVRIQEYWRMRFGDAPGVPDLDRWSEAQVIEELQRRLREAVRVRLVADVPLGVFLSGGIDSSLVTAAMAELVPPSSIKTFSITFDDPSFDEGPHARKVAAHLGTDHHEERLSSQVMLDILPGVADFMCEPLGDASIIPTYLLSRFARQTVTVALGGDGGDELFLGYPTFQADRVALGLDRLLSSAQERRVGSWARRAARLLPVSRRNMSLDFKLKRFAQGLGYAPDLRHQAWMGSFMPDEAAALFSKEYGRHALAQNPYALVASFRDRGGYRDHWDAVTYQYARLYLTGCVLTKVDRASMACGLEVRAPLLDTQLVDFASALPGELKLRGLTTKYVLKQAARRYLPREILERPKKGFGVPVGEWLRGPLRPFAEELLSSYNIGALGYFDVRETSRLLSEHLAGAADHRKALWTLISFLSWHERYGPGGSLCRPASSGDGAASGSSVVHRLEARS